MVYPGAGIAVSTGSAWGNSLQLSASGDRWGVLPYIDVNGVMEVGRIIDFHESDEDTGDAATRIHCYNNTLFFYKGAGDEMLARFISDGACELYYDNSKKLETFSTGTRFYGHIYMQKASGTENESPGLTYDATDDFAYNGLFLQHYGCGFHRPIAFSGTETGFYASGYYGIDLFTGGQLRFTILENGNVGIGTFNPLYLLDVNGTISASYLSVLNNINLSGTLLGSSTVPVELPYIIKKVASSTVRNSNDTETSRGGTTYVCAKKIRFNNGFIGQFRAYFDLKYVHYVGAGNTAYGKVYKNGSPIGTEKSTTSTTYVTMSDNITTDLAPGDEIQLYIRTNDYSHEDEAFVRNFRIAYDNNPTVTVSTTNTQTT